MELQTLKHELSNTLHSIVLNKHLLCSNAVCFNNNVDLILELKQKLSSHFKVPIRDIEVVGSAKLGISLSKERYGERYTENSDIDFVIVSLNLFDRAWHELLELDYQRYKLEEKEIQFLEDCYDTIHRGFISPNKLPLRSCFRGHWWEIFETLSSKKEYEYRKIRGRLFKDWWFVEKYYLINLKRLVGG